ncbi:MAG TPA: sigma-70 family RNA polymerase sigma factor [Terriglobia bacterium]|nr:sigma-70 family RNA polymerase sigma factor [Terriglobia bacterium]
MSPETELHSPQPPDQDPEDCQLDVSGGSESLVSPHPFDRVVTEPSRDEIEREVVGLYQENASRLLRYATTFVNGRELAQDALQEALMRYFVLRLAGLCIRNPRAWLYRVVRNFLLDRRKELGTRGRVNLDEIVELPDWRAHPDDLYHQNERTRSFLGQLSSRELECVRLRAEGFDYKEISAILNVRTGTVGALLARALKKLRKTRKLE